MTSPAESQWKRGLLAGGAGGCCQRGSELGLERWPGFGARGRRRPYHHQQVGSSCGCSRSGGRSRGWSGGGACELPRVARTPQTRRERFRWAELPSPLRTALPSRPRQQGWGLPGAGLAVGKPSPPSRVLGLPQSRAPSNSRWRPENGDHPKTRSFSLAPKLCQVVAVSSPLLLPSLQLGSD